MSEIIIRSTNAEALKKLADLVRFFGLEVEIVKEKVKKTNLTPQEIMQTLPITLATKPDALALAGIWKNKKINVNQTELIQEELRQKAWGNRL
jgi:hypothetical protein